MEAIDLLNCQSVQVPSSEEVVDAAHIILTAHLVVGVILIYIGGRGAQVGQDEHERAAAAMG